MCLCVLGGRYICCCYCVSMGFCWEMNWENTHHSNVTDEQYEKRLLLKFRSDFPSSHFPKKKIKDDLLAQTNHEKNLDCAVIL